MVIINNRMIFADEVSEVDSYIVKYKDNSVKLFSADEEPIAFSDNLYVVDAEYAKTLANDSNVEYVEPNYQVELFDCPNDEYYSEQWSLMDWGYNNIFKNTKGGQGVRVGVIDSGVASHPDLENISKDSFDIIKGDNECDDTFGHGTFVSGIIGANVNNGIGIAGIAPNSEIVVIKCFSGKTTKVSYVISAINYATTMNLDVLNMSFGVSFTNANGGNSLALKEAVDNLYDSGTIIVAAIGNSGNSTLYYPAAYDNVIGVGSVDSEFVAADSSQHNESVFVTAPGENIYGLWSPNTEENLYYNTCSGTSFAAPYVTGLIAIAKSYNKNFDFNDICNLLKNSTKDYGDKGYDTTYGWGVVNPKVFVDNLYGGSKVFITQPNCKINDDNSITIAQNVINNSGKNLSLYYVLYVNDKIAEITDYELDDEVNIKFKNKISDNSVIKCFVWDSLNTLIPYYDCFVVY
jgi:subtilisin family serine protease